jgi:hypothetical protein
MNDYLYRNFIQTMETLQNVGSKMAPGAGDTDGRGISVTGREGDVT